MAAIQGQPAPKPGSIGSPVPGDDEAKALEAFLAQQKPASLPSTGGTDAEAQALDQFVGSAPPAPSGPSLTDQALSAGGTALDVAGRTLDYPGGLVRTGLAGAAGALAGNPDIVKPEDLKNAVKGKAPSSAEYLTRLGVPEGGSLNLPGLGKVTTRGAAGLALDIATDPLTALSKLVKEVPYIGKLINAPGRAMEAAGEATYKSALPKGAEAVGDVLIQEGAPIGGAATIAKKVDDISGTMGKLRQGMYDKATELGVTVDTAYPLKNAEAVLAKMERDPGLKPAASELRDLLERYKSAGKISVDQMSEWKTGLYDSLPKSAWGANGKLKGTSQQFRAALASDFRQAIAEAGNKAEKGLGDSINAVNEKWGTLLDATKPLDKAAAGSGGGKLGQMIDGAVLATGNVKALALKKAYDVATSPAARTAIGKALMEAGRKGVANRMIIDANQTVNPVPPTLRK